jgi:hypothetical protein
MKVSIKKTDKSLDDKSTSAIKKFLNFLQNKLSLTDDVKFVFVDKRDGNMTTGVRLPKHTIHVLSKGRLLIDILRTISHEWVHEYQHQKMGYKDTDKIQDIGGPEENMSNVLSGIFIKQFQKKYPNLNKVVYNESISSKSNGTNGFLKLMKENPDYMNELGFKNFDRLEDYVITGTNEEFLELKEELNEIHKKKDKYIDGEMDEIERAVQDLSRDGDIETTVKDVVSAFTKAKKVDLTKDIWSKLENTESNKFKKGDIKKVNALALKYNKTSPLKLKKALLSGDYDSPMILQFGNRYHLVAGNTRLSTAAALGITPKVLIGKI